MGCFWVRLHPAGGSLHGLMQSLALSGPQWRMSRKVTFLPRAILATEGQSRRVAQSGGLGRSWEDEPEKMEAEAGRSSWSWREMVRSGNDKPLLVIPALSPGESRGHAGFVQGSLGHELGDSLTQI